LAALPARFNQNRMKLFGLALVVIAAVSAGQTLAAEPARTDLFSAGTHGFDAYRIPGLIITADGTLLAYCEAREGGSDWSNQRLVLRRSTDGGKTWSAQREILMLPELREELGHAQTNARTYHNLVMIPDPGGAVHAIFCLDYWRTFYATSEDDGLTWSEPREITDVIARYREKDWNWRVVGNGTGHGLRLENGRLLVPLWLSTSTQTRGHGHRPSHVGVLFSDDRGATWQIGDWVAKHLPPALLTPNETCAVQLADGRVLFNMRHETKNHRRAVSISPNGATDWSTPFFDEALFDPVCEASILRLTKVPASDRHRILFCNPDSRPADPNSKELSRRRNLTLKLSYDEAETWPVRKVLEPGIAGYSDLATDGRGNIFCLFERGSTKSGDHFRTAAITLAKFSLAWLEGTHAPAR
jgi:sialidase-1